MKKFIIVISIFLILVTILGAYVFSQFKTTPSKETTVVYIKKGSSLSQTADILSSSGAVKNGYIFTAYAYYTGKHKRFYPGRYVFNINTSYSRAIDMIAKGPKKIIYKLTIPEGFTVKQIRERVYKKLGVSKESFDNAFKKYEQLYHPFGEGYLFPDTYFFNGNVKAEQVIDRLYNQFNQSMKNIQYFQDEDAGVFSAQSIVTIASLIQMEAKLPGEQKLVSAVIYNRLKKDMRLEIDATIQYILSDRKKKLTRKDLKINSPYNTYRNKGLPPGPISNPGMDALTAAANPAKVNYLYYVLTDPKTGKHFFTNDYKKFLEEKKKAGSKK